VQTVRYREGDWFAVSLLDSGFAAGLIARVNPKGALLGYFFGPRRREMPRLHDVSGLRPGDALLVRKFGHLGIVHGTWPLLGRLDSWERQDWPTPVFLRYEELTGRSFHVFYDDKDPNKVLREKQGRARGSRAGTQRRPDGRGLHRSNPHPATDLSSFRSSA
jgi:hypothetical protein